GPGNLQRAGSQLRALRPRDHRRAQPVARRPGRRGRPPDQGRHRPPRRHRQPGPTPRGHRRGRLRGGRL
ncbi:MAG: hypothetical protein AVDCRST_MAG49-3868, partial [uncultured Thermomicrobiales bacterium]